MASSYRLTCLKTERAFIKIPCPMANFMPNDPVFGWA